MKLKIVVGILILTLACPPVSHGFGVLRWAFDAVANQLGFDRGPIPKVKPNVPPPDYQKPCGPPTAKHPDTHRLYIQAEGF